MSGRRAVGIHVFAGGFTMGVKRVFDVPCQLETHGFGRETCEALGVEFVNEPEAAWPDLEGEMAFGNPRCTGFSCITSGYGKETHGAWSKQTIDVHQLCKYAVDRFDVIVWESVQQAYSVGRPLLDHLVKDVFAPKHYRIAHVMLNAASFGNCQQRKRYFFIAYRDDRNFNIVPPVIATRFSVLYDAIWDLRDRECNERRLFKRDCEYDENSHVVLTDDEKHCVPNLPNGWGLNAMGRYAYDKLPPKYQVTWDTRLSGMPFSMHCIHRANWLRPCPTLHSSSGRLIHPDHHRPLTVRELSTVMGWDVIPSGPLPVAQIVKGIVPDAGEWLARQVVRYLDNEWGDEDWESTYDDNAGEWKGENARGKLEKFFNLTRYVSKEPPDHDLEPVQRHRHRVDVSRLRPSSLRRQARQQDRGDAGTS